MRTVFFGSPDYALPALRGLLDAPDVEVVGVVTQPDRPRGRSGSTVPTEVHALAAAEGIAVRTPQRIRRDTTEWVAALRPEVGVLAASGHLLPRHLLAVFPYGVLNVHASLLPRHRGAAPVAAAILAGDEQTGAAIMRIVPELDAGPVLGTVTTPIAPLDTAGTLTARIARLGAELLLELLPRWVAGELPELPQEEAQASHAPRLSKRDGAIDWTRPASELWRRVRAFHPWPLATTDYAGRRLTLHHVWPVESPLEATRDTAAERAPGTVHAGDGRDLSPLLPGRRAVAVVACGEGALALLRIQRSGKRAQDIERYLNGDPGLIGAHLG